MRKQLRKRIKIHIYIVKVLINTSDEFPNQAQLTRDVGDASRKGLSARGDACWQGSQRAEWSEILIEESDDL